MEYAELIAAAFGFAYGCLLSGYVHACREKYRKLNEREAQIFREEQEERERKASELRGRMRAKGIME